MNREDILLLGHELRELITETEEYRLYKVAYEAVKNNEEINVLIHTIETLQKELVTLKHIEKKQAVLQKDQELELLKKELLGIPLYDDYLHYQSELDSLIQEVAYQIQMALK